MDLELMVDDDTSFMDLMASQEDDEEEEHGSCYTQEPSGSLNSEASMEEYLDFDFELEEEDTRTVVETDPTSPMSLTNDGELDMDSDMEPPEFEEGEEDDGPESDTEEPPEAIGHIERMVLNFLTQLANKGLSAPSESGSDDSMSEGEEAVSATTKRKEPRPQIEVLLADRRKLGQDGELGTRSIKYPRRVAGGSARPLAQLFNVLNISHEALVTGVPTTKRDVYYKDVSLFKSQGTVDRLVDDLAATWELKRSDLNIRAASKGLVCGAGLSIELFTGETLTGKDTDGINIPVGEDIESFGIDEEVNWILVVEKEAVFQTLCRLGVADHPSMPGRGIIITGKGYPDVATRHLVKSLADALPKRIPIAALVDCDPYGLDILSVYRYGSVSMQHENDTLAARRIKWLGLRTSELSELGIDWDNLLPISKADEKKILAMLAKPNIPKKWKRELSRSLHLRRKAEIEIISSTSEYPL
ncbi:Spo11/DNA topoisomerase VI subunit A [Ephemerocybe angulata]|uniref:DNA topoisomerase (ATP-hydrolyzing) n=1 Tax=Ephemerocybe angulata TaxID=980116 RepID=A0A8H6MG63_9AGAR|nr:Spo11/DNA topoisomerase VI subunit A [Tulosesus angulatus]